MASPGQAAAAAARVTDDSGDDASVTPILQPSVMSGQRSSAASSGVISGAAASAAPASPAASSHQFSMNQLFSRRSIARGLPSRPSPGYPVDVAMGVIPATAPVATPPGPVISQASVSAPAIALPMSQAGPMNSTSTLVELAPSVSAPISFIPTTERKRQQRGNVPRVAEQRLQAVFDMFAINNPSNATDARVQQQQQQQQRRIHVSALREVVALLHIEDLPNDEFDASIRTASHLPETGLLPQTIDYPDFLNFMALMSRRVPAEEYSAEKLFNMLNLGKDGKHVSDSQLMSVMASVGLELSEEQARCMAAEATRESSRPGAQSITFEDFNSIWSRCKTATDELSNRKSSISSEASRPVHDLT